MQITIDISNKVQKVFGKGLDNLNFPDIRKAVIIKYLEDILSDDNLELAVFQYLDSIEESGELDDILHEIEY